MVRKSYFFFDASAIVKLLICEEGSTEVATWYRERAGLLSELTFVEVAAAIARGCRFGRYSEAERDEILADADRVLSRVTVVPLSSYVMHRAKLNAAEAQLRAGDLIQLTSAQVGAAQLDLAVTMVTYDKELWRVSKEQGLGVLPADLV